MGGVKIEKPNAEILPSSTLHRNWPALSALHSYIARSSHTFPPVDGQLPTSQALIPTRLSGPPPVSPSRTSPTLSSLTLPVRKIVACFKSSDALGFAVALVSGGVEPEVV